MQDVTDTVLKFWFGTPESNPEGGPLPLWFKSSPEVDADIRARFLDVYERARDGAFDDVASSADDFLAVVLVLDQFPRNMFRGQPQAFATDSLARRWASRAVDAGLDLRQPAPHRRLFFYLPYEHSEDMADQDRSVELIGTLGDAEYSKYAVAHRDVIAAYGRFPHRNAILGRASTADEEDYLSRPGAGF